MTGQRQRSSAVREACGPARLRPTVVTGTPEYTVKRLQSLVRLPFREHAAWVHLPGRGQAFDKTHCVKASPSSSAAVVESRCPLWSAWTEGLHLPAKDVTKEPLARPTGALCVQHPHDALQRSKVDAGAEVLAFAAQHHLQAQVHRYSRQPLETQLNRGSGHARRTARTSGCASSTSRACVRQTCYPCSRCEAEASSGTVQQYSSPQAGLRFAAYLRQLVPHLSAHGIALSWPRELQHGIAFWSHIQRQRSELWQRHRSSAVNDLQQIRAQRSRSAEPKACVCCSLNGAGEGKYSRYTGLDGLVFSTKRTIIAGCTTQETLIYTAPVGLRCLCSRSTQVCVQCTPKTYVWCSCHYRVHCLEREPLSDARSQPVRACGCTGSLLCLHACCAASRGLRVAPGRRRPAAATMRSLALQQPPAQRTSRPRFERCGRGLHALLCCERWPAVWSTGMLSHCKDARTHVLTVLAGG